MLDEYFDDVADFDQIALVGDWDCRGDRQVDSAGSCVKLGAHLEVFFAFYFDSAACRGRTVLLSPKVLLEDGFKFLDRLLADRVVHLDYHLRHLVEEKLVLVENDLAIASGRAAPAASTHIRRDLLPNLVVKSWVLETLDRDLLGPTEL